MYEFGNFKGYELSFSNNSPFSMSVYLYLLDDIMIDTGQPNMRDAVLNICRKHGLRQIVLTHYHEDHSGNALALKMKYGARVMGNIITSKIMRRNIRPLNPYRRIIWGQPPPSMEISILPEIIQTESFSLFPIHTPGHSVDHTAYIEKSRGWLFSGDIYLSNKIKFFHSDENMSDYVKSLKKILSYDFDMLLCSHNPVFTNGKRRIRKKLSFFEDMIGKVSRFIEAGMVETEIINYFDKGNDHLIKKASMGELSLQNMICSAIRAI